MSNQQQRTENLPPFVIRDKETGEHKVQLQTLPDALFDAILDDTSRDVPGTASPREWYKLRQTVMALRMVRQEVASGSPEAQAELGDPENWQPRMPVDWEQYIQPYTQPDQPPQT